MAGIVRAPQKRPETLSIVNTTRQLGLVEEDERWGLGFSFQPDPCGDGGISAACNPGAFTVDDRLPKVDFEPYVVYGGDHCSTFGFTAENYADRARALLERSQSKQIAAELWTGDLAAAETWPNLSFAGTATDSDTVTDGPSSVITVLACLEQALAQCGGGDQGMIHATRQLVTHWAALGPSVLRREGGLLLTVHDTIVVADAGYDGSGPGGVAAGASQWAYASGLVEVRLGAIQMTPDTLAEATDRAVNTIEYVAWRPAAAVFDGCCLFAAEADLAVCAIGGVS